MIRISVGNDGKVYAFRDVFDHHGKLITCQYGVWLQGKLRWTDCAEGCSFAATEPVA